MKSVILKGQIITIGSKVRFVDDRDLYPGCDHVKKPSVGIVYEVRGFSDKNGFLLEEVKNRNVEWVNENGDYDGESEPGFAVWRFEPGQPIRKKKIVQIEILPMIEERLEIRTKKSKPKEVLQA
jgi:hypothetical protein